MTAVNNTCPEHTNTVACRSPRKLHHNKQGILSQGTFLLMQTLACNGDLWLPFCTEKSVQSAGRLQQCAAILQPVDVPAAVLISCGRGFCGTFYASVSPQVVGSGMYPMQYMSSSTLVWHCMALPPTCMGIRVESGAHMVAAGIAHRQTL